MNRILSIVLALGLLAAGGCSVDSAALIRANSASSRTDVFAEPAGSGMAPQGLSDLNISGSLKTHKPDAHAMADSHGTPDYNLLVNIDGQVVLMCGDLQKENSEPTKLVDSEAGEGIRYRFSKKLRLKTGTHRLVVALPEDGVAVEKIITLVEGSVNNMVLEPLYYSTSVSRKLGGHGPTNFKEGIRGIRLILNGRRM